MIAKATGMTVEHVSRRLNADTEPAAKKTCSYMGGVDSGGFL